MANRALSVATCVVVRGEECTGIGNLARRCGEYVMQDIELAGVDREAPGVAKAAAAHRVLAKTSEIIEIHPHAVEDHLDPGGAGVEQHLGAGVQQLMTIRRPGRPQTGTEVPTRRPGKRGATHPLAGGQDVEEVANTQGTLGDGQQRHGTERDPMSTLPCGDLFIGHTDRVRVVDLWKDNAGQPTVDADAKVVSEIGRGDLVGPHPEIRGGPCARLSQSAGDDAARSLPFLAGNGVL